MIPYAILVLGMPVIYAILYALPDSPGTGMWIYLVPLVCLAGFAGTIPVARYKRKWIHVLVGIAATPLLFLGNIAVFGWLAIMRSGLEGTQ